MDSGAAGTSWIGRGSRQPAREKMEAFVRDLKRAKTRQVLVEYGCKGLFWGLVIACTGVLVIRLAHLPYAAWRVVAYVLCLTLAASAVIAWRRRPDELRVAILADLDLNLKQKLSTAWEFARSGADPVVVERLAVQAVKARLPSRCDRVFPLHIDTWGRLVPVAAMLLVLVSIADLQWTPDPVSPSVDEFVVGEGARLREYGRQMEGRARREELPQSAEAAQQMRRLGTRMESGALSRRQAVSRLRQLGDSLDNQRAAVLRDSMETKIGPLDIKSLVRSPLMRRSNLRTMLRKLLDGSLKPEDLEFLGEDPAALSRLGITPEKLQEALDSFDADDRDKLRGILEELSRAKQAMSESEELRKAGEEVRRTRENLGDAGGTAEGNGDRAQEGSGGADDGSEDDASARTADDIAGGDGDVVSSRQGGGYSFEGASETRRETSTPGANEDGIIMKPKSQLLREGGVFTSEARVLPRAGPGTVNRVTLDTAFTAQLEEVLAKEQYPLHHKEFIRRYFLGLSEGVVDDSAAGEDAGQ